MCSGVWMLTGGDRWCLGGVWGVSGGCLGGVWGCLGVSGECLGASGGVWGVLDGVWMVLKTLFPIRALCAPPWDIQESWTLGLIGLTVWNNDLSEVQFQGEGSSHELAAVLFTECIQHSLYTTKKPLYAL